MFAGDIACAPTVSKTANCAHRAVIQHSTIRQFFCQSLVNATPNHLGERQATVASLGT